MTRVDGLKKKYPSIPKEVIAKWDVLNRGVRDSEDLDGVCHWQKAGAHFSYQSYDHDVTLKQWVDKKPTRLEGDRILRPGTIMMKNGVGMAIRLDTTSPYEIRRLGNGQFGLFEGEEKVDVNTYFPPPVRRPTDGLMTSGGTPIGSLFSCPRRCVAIMPVRYCEYFATGEQCKFCNFNNTQEDSRSIGLDRSVTLNLNEVVEGYKILSSEVRLLEAKFEMGGFMKSDREGRIYFDFVGNVANAASYKPNFAVRTQAMDRKDLQRLKDAGLDCISIQLEVWDPELFSVILPGKAKHASREVWLESFLESVDVLGAGNVGGKIIAGLSMIPE
ncbi:MAG: hypothetical protein Q7O66_23550, partial [Dehalococcoidia bacterium]|nr:hypothetical protein [Dehalococcoidia bacterium]